MKMLDTKFKKVSWNIHPTVLTSLTAMTVSQGKKKTTLRPYVAPVNHNVLNTEKAINIAHTIWGNFCHGDKSKNSQMETMGMDSCMIVGYHDKVSENSGYSIILFQIRIICLFFLFCLSFDNK
jgi:hypothetical protein